MKARAARAGASAAGILLAAALLVGANYLSIRHWKRGDWTRTQIYSLSEKTKKILAGLKSPVRVTVFMTPRARLYTEVKELLARYQAASPKIEVEYLDPERNRARAEAVVKELGIRAETVVFRSGDRKKYVEEDKLADFDYGMGMGAAPSVKAFKGEEAFTSAILTVTEDKPGKIYFSQGHGEASIDSTERGKGYADAKALLERDNLTVATWDSLGKDALPADADVLIVAGPKTAFLEPEAGALEKHLASGGRLLLLLDPILPGPGAPPADYGLSRVLDKYGLKVGNDLVVDPANALPMVGEETVLANRYGNNPIVRSLSQEGLPVILPLARSVTKAEKPPPGIDESMLVETSADGWGETNLQQLDRVQKGPGDTPGPVSLAVALGPAEEKSVEAKTPRNGVEAKTPPVEGEPKTPRNAAEVKTPPVADDAKTPRAVVVGNSLFATNGALRNGANALFFANAVHWLSGREKQIGIAPKTPEQASLSLTDSQVRRIGLASILGLPGLAILLGLWVWYKRRD